MGMGLNFIDFRRHADPQDQKLALQEAAGRAANTYSVVAGDWLSLAATERDQLRDQIVVPFKRVVQSARALLAAYRARAASAFQQADNELAAAEKRLDTFGREHKLANCVNSSGAVTPLRG